jgi:hypothetical protein
MPTWLLALLGFFGVVLVLGGCVAMAIAIAALDR